MSLCFALNVRSRVRIYYYSCAYTSLDRGYFSPCGHVFLSSLWMALSVFGYIVTDCPCIGSSLDRHFYLCFSLSVSVISTYITANSTCICTSLYLCFPLTFCLSMCIPVSEYIIIHSWCMYTSFDSCFSLSFHFFFFLSLFMSVFGYIITDVRI